MADGHRLPVPDVEDMLGGPGLQQYVDEPAQVADVKELQFHFAVPGQVEGPADQGAVEHEGLPVHVVHRAVEFIGP